jgi:hypothetical protein
VGNARLPLQIHHKTFRLTDRRLHGRRVLEQGPPISDGRTIQRGTDPASTQIAPSLERRRQPQRRGPSPRAPHRRPLSSGPNLGLLLPFACVSRRLSLPRRCAGLSSVCSICFLAEHWTLVPRGAPSNPLEKVNRQQNQNYQNDDSYNGHGISFWFEFSNFPITASQKPRSIGLGLPLAPLGRRTMLAIAVPKTLPGTFDLGRGRGQQGSNYDTGRQPKTAERRIAPLARLEPKFLSAANSRNPPCRSTNSSAMSAGAASMS